MKQNKRKLKFRKRNILTIVSVVLMILFFILLMQLNVVPTLYMVILIGGFFLVNVLGFVLLNAKPKVLIVLGSIFLILSIAISSVGIYYVYHTNRFLNVMFNTNTITNSNTYYLVKSKANEVKKEEVQGDVLYFDNDSKMKKAIKELKNNYEVSMKQENDIKEMFLKVKDENQLMLVESSSYKFVFNLEKEIKEEDYEILDEIEVKTIVKVKEKKKNSNSLNLYLSGTDFSYNTVDFNMIATVNLDTNEILLTSIPRDFYIPVYGREDGARDTLSYMGPYGIDVSVGSLENFFDTELDYYVRVNNRSVVDIVNAIGGINYCSDQAFSVNYITKAGYDKNANVNTTRKQVYIHEGCQTLDGNETLSVIRVRKIFEGGDRARQDHIRKVIVAMLDRLKDPNVIMNYANILDSLTGLYETTMPRELISKLAKQTIDNGGNWKIIEQSVTGEDKQDYVHLTSLIDYVMEPDMNSVESAKKQIKQILNNK